MNNLFLIQMYALMAAFPAVLAYMDFFHFLGTDKRLFRWGAVTLDLFILALPPLLLYFCDAGDSRGNNTIIYPLYRPMVYSLVLLCLMAYFYAAWRKSLTHPLLEVFINCSLLLGVVMNILIVIRMRDASACFAINLPATLFLILALVRNHRLVLYTLEDDYVDVLEPARKGWPNQAGGSLSEGQTLDLSGKRVTFFSVARFPDITRVCWNLLQMRPVMKICVLVALSLPVAIELTKMLLFTGRM